MDHIHETLSVYMTHTQIHINTSSSPIHASVPTTNLYSLQKINKGNSSFLRNSGILFHSGSKPTVRLDFYYLDLTSDYHVI